MLCGFIVVIIYGLVRGVACYRRIMDSYAAQVTENTNQIRS